MAHYAQASSRELDQWQVQCEHALRFLVCASTFMRQKLAGIGRQKLAAIGKTPLQRHARKRVVAAGWAQEPLVSVVHFRERSRGGIRPIRSRA
jgi:hypothetical protein